MIRVWCGVHQLDFKMHIIFQRGLDKEFFFIRTTLIRNLHRQQDLVTEMRATCPKVANIRGLSIRKTLKVAVRKLCMSLTIFEQEIVCVQSPFYKIDVSICSECFC